MRHLITYERTFTSFLFLFDIFFIGTVDDEDKCLYVVISMGCCSCDRLCEVRGLRIDIVVLFNAS